jgi:hypothetical protein
MPRELPREFFVFGLQGTGKYFRSVPKYGRRPPFPVE